MLKTKIFSGKTEKNLEEEMDSFFLEFKISEKNIVSITSSASEYMIVILLIYKK